MGPILGALLAAGFYKFIKVLEYETANPGQDADHDAQVENRKQHLVAAGINDNDAQHVAQELQEKNAGGDNGGVNGGIMAHGQGRRSQDGDPNGMYGTQFRSSQDDINRSSGASEQTYIQRPTASATGRYSYLANAGRQPSNYSNNVGAQGTSPAMAIPDERYAGNGAVSNASPGHMVAGSESRNRFSRTNSGGV